MKQAPSALKYRKLHKPSKSFLEIVEQKNFYPQEGLYALKCLQPGRLTWKQIEAGRKSIRRSVHKDGKIYIKVFPYASLTKRPVGVRMGKGKGSHHVWVCPVKAGHILFELKGLKEQTAVLALKLAADKMPFRCSVIKLTY
jgi:large subunit ribosomal protein L16